MKCVSYTRTMPWKNHKGELTIADQNQRIAEYLAEHKEMDLHNNEIGRQIGQKNENLNESEMSDLIYQEVNKANSNFIWLHG